MARERTSGFDLLIQISEDELNNQIANAFFSGDIFTPSAEIPDISVSESITATAFINFHAPVAYLLPHTQHPRMSLKVRFSNSRLEVNRKSDGSPLTTLEGFSGWITIAADIKMPNVANVQRAVMDFVDGDPDPGVEFDAANPTTAILATLLDGQRPPLSLADAENLMADRVLKEVQDNIRYFPLSPYIPIHPYDGSPVADIDVTTVIDLSIWFRDCLTFGVRLANTFGGNESGGNIDAVTTSFFGSGGAVVMMSNELLWRRLRIAVAEALGISESDDFDHPFRLKRAVPMSDGGELTQLEAALEEDRIHAWGRWKKSSSGGFVVSDFSVFLDFSVVDGTVVITATTPDVITDVVVTEGNSLLGIPILGVLFAPGVWAFQEIAEGWAGILQIEGLVSTLVANALGDLALLGGRTKLPLGPVGDWMEFHSVQLDDVEMQGSVIPALTIRTRNQGVHSSDSGFTVDLDSGVIGSDVGRLTDLIWNPNHSGGFSTNDPAGLEVIPAAYSTLTPQVLSTHALADSAIALMDIPISSTSDVTPIVFGVRTTDGRYARVVAILYEGGSIILVWETYDNPLPRLDIAARWSVIEEGEPRKIFFCEDFPVRWGGRFEAEAKLLTIPIDYQWCLCGTSLKEGEGTVDTLYGPLTYKLRNQNSQLEMETTRLEQWVQCELCVSAIDARGHELFTCIQLSQRGLDRRCPPAPTPPKEAPILRIIEPGPELRGWRRLMSEIAGFIND